MALKYGSTKTTAGVILVCNRCSPTVRVNQFDTASALLRYRELRVSNYLPTAISLLEDM
jgi:hypothetical protein